MAYALTHRASARAFATINNTSLISLRAASVARRAACVSVLVRLSFRSPIKIYQLLSI
jgi:hypothetical protein